MVKYDVRRETWEYKEPFIIARHYALALDVIVVEIEVDGKVGRGEAAGVDYHGETMDLMIEQVHGVLAGRDRPPIADDLLSMLPSGGARNAIDCALWDLKAKCTGKSIWNMAGISDPKPLRTAYTLSLQDPDIMAEKAQHAPGNVLKLKLGGNDGMDLARVKSVHAAVPDHVLMIDYNGGANASELFRDVKQMADCGVVLIEQPLPKDSDHALWSLNSPIPICADESFDDETSFEAIAGKYQSINVKLDKCGGLTAALRCARKARARNLTLFTGSMCGTSLAMAPAFVVAQLGEYVDLDGPLLSRFDRPYGMRFDAGMIHPFEVALWG